jgi:hypothetical protein
VVTVQEMVESNTKGSRSRRESPGVFTGDFFLLSSAKREPYFFSFF